MVLRKPPVEGLCVLYECACMPVSVSVRVCVYAAVSLVISITCHHHWRILLRSVFIPMPDEDAAVIKISRKMK